MTNATKYQHRAFLAIIAGSAAVVGIAVTTAGSLASTTRDTTPTFGTFVRSAEFPEPATLAIVPSPVIDTHAQFYFGTADGSSGYYAEKPYS